MSRMEIRVKAGDHAEFHNQVDYCIGTGRMGLALHKEYHDQLKLVQDEIGFQHIRGHGLFCDDMAIYQEHRENPWDKDSPCEVEYNFTYLDRVMDDYRSLGLKPFLELGFMPERMASGTQTIFYWKGNTTPPKSYEAWKDMVQALLRHLIGRYGEEAYSYPIEVWNEPNLPGFWYKADMEEYFKLFRESFYAIKEVSPRFRVGGPAVCGGTDEKWISAFMEFCHVNQIPVDFVTRHHYTTEFPERDGHYGYAELMDEEDGFANLKTTRDIIDRYEEYRGLQIHITEYNTSYIPNCPLHDTNQNAAYIAKQLSRLGDGNESYSYWTFGDVFEEQGVPFTPFHGGFGLVANGCIPKPTFWTFVFFKNLKRGEGECVFKNDNAVIMKMKDGSFRGVLWNDTRKRAGKDMTVKLSLEAPAGEYCILTKRVDEDTCNPLKLWHDIGEPANPDKAQTELIKSAAQPFVRTMRRKAVACTCAAGAASGATGMALSDPENGTKRIAPVDSVLEFEVELPENAVVYFEAKNAPVKPDRGYHYEHVTQQKGINPLTCLDYPDVDVIRVGDTYYMVSTTMYFMPGCEILRSYNLKDWEHAAFVYDRLDSTPGQRLEGEENIYGQGMWAASLRYHEGMYYVIFVANDTHKTYLYRAKDIEGPWEKSEIKGFYHDNSLLFDDDGRVYIVYGNREVHLTELAPDLSGPKEGGLDRIVIKDRDDAYLGYEGAHFYKINGKYYIFFIHMPRETGRRTEACFMADSPEGEFTGGDVMSDDRGYCGSGVAQGGIVDTPEGNWYAILFQDSGAVGRIPILMPMRWNQETGMPELGNRDGKIPQIFPTPDSRPGYVYESLVGSDDFRGCGERIEGSESARKYASFGFKSRWQFNHEPDMTLVSKDAEKGIVTIRTNKLSRNLVQARNVLTQRTMYPGCAAEVLVDGSGLGEGDYAGLCLLESAYAFIGLTRRNGELWLVMKNRKAPDGLWGERRDVEPGDELAAVKVTPSMLQEGPYVDANAETKMAENAEENKTSEATKDGASVQESGKEGNSVQESGNTWVRLRAEADFAYMRDEGRLYYMDGDERKALGPVSKLQFKLDHFTGVRFGLFVYSTEKPDACAGFADFIYQKKVDGMWERC